jgi:CubicO group peptidase (beta-lactamase class C family)
MPTAKKQSFLKPLMHLTALVGIFAFVGIGISEDITSEAKKNWKKYKTPEEAGFSSAKLLDAKAYWEELRPAAAAIMVIYKGKVLVEWGDTKSPYMCHSVRKSFMSALYGIHVKEGHIGLQKTMAELGIDDVPPLTEAEKQARVIQLLKARSGVYHEAAYESPGMKEIRPERGSHAPGTFWYYNNWDFNTLGTIFEQETGTKIFEEYKARIADPIGMQDFRLDLCYYHYEWDLSIHPAYPFQMSARDRARFGQLFLQEGRWDDTQIITKKWIKKSTKAYSDVSSLDEVMKGFGYGYMWWTIDDFVPIFQQTEYLKDIGAGYYASGYGGHVIIILPEQEMVFVQVVDTFQGLNVEGEESYVLLEKIFAAREQQIFDLSAVKTWFSPQNITRGESITISARVKNLSRKVSIPTGVDFYLSTNNKLNAKDIHIGYAKLSKIKYKKKKIAKLNTVILDTVQPGEYYLIAHVDQDNVNLDPYPKNNIGASQGKLVLK